MAKKDYLFAGMNIFVKIKPPSFKFFVTAAKIFNAARDTISLYVDYYKKYFKTKLWQCCD